MQNLRSVKIKPGMARLISETLRCVHTTICRAQQLTQRTFEKGMPWPAFQPDSDMWRLYSMRFCPYAQRTRLVLAHKKIPYETVNVHLRRKPDWLLERNPKGRVPILEHPDGRLLFESLVVNQYLDEIYPQDKLLPADSYIKARDELMVDFCDRFMTAIFHLWTSQGTSEEGTKIFLKGFKLYEKELNSRLPDGPFFGGCKPAMGDYNIWPWLERAHIISSYASLDTGDKTSPSKALITPNNFPLLHAWVEAMYKLPAVQETMFDMESHMRFSHSYSSDNPDYDMGLENEPPLPDAVL